MDASMDARGTQNTFTIAKKEIHADVAEIYKFDELTWPEVNQAVAMGKIPIIPTGSLNNMATTSRSR